MITKDQELTYAQESSVRWKNYAEDLKKERDGWMSEYRAARSEVERLKELLAARDHALEYYEKTLKERDENI
jgi:hypothetical protein